MDTTQFMMTLAWVGNLLALAMLAGSMWDTVRGRRAARRMALGLAERDEYRPLLASLVSRAREHDGALPISEHEAIDLREQVRRALVHVHPGDRRRIEDGLFARTVRAREVYLRRVLYASMRRLQHQP